MTAALEGVEWSAARPGRTLPSGKTRYPFYRRLGRPQGRSGRAENLIPTGIQSRTVQPVVSRYTDWATRPHVTRHKWYFLSLSHRHTLKHQTIGFVSFVWYKQNVTQPIPLWGPIYYREWRMCFVVYKGHISAYVEKDNNTGNVDTEGRSCNHCCTRKELVLYILSVCL